MNVALLFATCRAMLDLFRLDSNEKHTFVCIIVPISNIAFCVLSYYYFIIIIIIFYKLILLLLLSFIKYNTILLLLFFN